METTRPNIFHLDNPVVAARPVLPVVLSNLPGTIGDAVARDALHLAHVCQIRLLIVTPPWTLKVSSHRAAGLATVRDGVPDVDGDVGVRAVIGVAFGAPVVLLVAGEGVAESSHAGFVPGIDDSDLDGTVYVDEG